MTSGRVRNDIVMAAKAAISLWNALLRREDNFNMTGTYIQKMRTEQVLLTAVADADLRHSNEVLIFANVVGKAFVTKSVDFACDDKAVCPNFYEHALNIKFLFQLGRFTSFF